MRKFLIGIVIFLTIFIVSIPSFAAVPQLILGVKAVEYYYDNPPDDESCPFLYTFNGTEFVLENDIVSVARAKVNEYTDYLFLNNSIVETEGKIKLKLKEIPNETSMLDYLGLYVVNHPAGTKAGVDEKGKAHTYSNPVAPTIANSNGLSVINNIATDDKQGVVLYDQENVVLEFPAMDLSQGAKLVLKADGFERNPSLPNTLAIKVPAIEIQTEENGNWVTRSKFFPKEYAAYGVYDLKPYLNQTNIKVRLLSDSCRLDVAHLIDYVALDNSADACTQAALPLTKALKNDTEDALSLLNSADNSYLELTTETDFVSLEFDSVNNAGINDYFFASKGYYVPLLNTFYVATKDDTGQWAERYSNSSVWYTGGADVTQEIDLTGFQNTTYFPNSNDTYQVRVSNTVGTFDNRWAYIDYAYLKVGGQLYAMTGAVDAASGEDVLAKLQSSDSVKWDALNRGVILTFTKSIPVTEVTLNKSATTINQGSQETLLATVLPSDASYKQLTWSSSNSAVAKVDQSGVVTAVSIGTARITATSTDGPSGGCDVTVNDTTPPAITQLTPAQDATISDPIPLISAKLTDLNAIDKTRVSLTLNGVAVGTFDQTSNVVSYKPNYILADGLYTAVVTAYDIFNNRSSTSWSFTVRDAGAPQITNLLPPNLMGTTTKRPKISANIADSGGFDFSKLSITVDGTPLSVNFQPEVPGSIVGGNVYGVPIADLSDAMHTAVLTVFDRAGNSQQKTWQFGVNTFAEMVADFSNCTACHNEGIYSLTDKHIANSGDCSLCHGRGIADIGDCSECHSHTWDIPMPLGNYPCTQCHNSNFWDVVPTHGSPSELISHNYTLLGQDCLSCHSSSLTKTHNIYVEGQTPINCLTCHQSTKPEVQAAINAGNLACSACHGAQANHDALHTSSLDPTCTTCHSDTLTTDHIANRPALGLNCNTCHNSQLETNSGFLDNKNCAKCHSAAHDINLVSATPADFPLYTEVTWSAPFEAKVYAGETWMPAEYLEGGKLLISKRSTGITGREIRDYYNSTLISSGWTLASTLPAEQSNYYEMTFTKNNNKVRISFYGGEDHTSTPLVETGYRVEILYK